MSLWLETFTDQRMIFMKRTLLLFTAALTLAAASAAAQDKAKETPRQETTKEAAKTTSVLKKEQAAQLGEPVRKWFDAENALIDPLSDRDKESFLLLREKYSIIKTIEIAEGDIGKAVQSCGKANPDMKDTMEDRFKQWRNAVDPIIDTAKKQFDKDLAAQKLVDAKKAKNVFKLQDEAYAFNEKMTTKQYSSKKEHCEGLLASMDRTEDQMIRLLEQTPLPESVIRQKYETSQKEKARAAAKAKTDDKPKAE
jgi:hypothetical protein